MTGKCPTCTKPVEKAVLTEISLGTTEQGAGQWRGVAYCCPACSTILSVQIDPAQTDGARGLAAWLARDDDPKA